MLRNAAAVFSSATLLSCGGNVEAADPIKLTKADSGRTISVSIGQRVEVVVPANATTGYRWSFQCEPEAALEAIGKPEYVPDQPVQTGSGGRERYRFRALRAGKATIRFEYRRSWERDASPAMTVSYVFIVG